MAYVRAKVLRHDDLARLHLAVTDDALVTRALESVGRRGGAPP